MAAADILYNRELLRWAASLYRWPLFEQFSMEKNMTANPCGSSIRVVANVDGRHRFEAIGINCQACAFGQASAAIMAHHIVGMLPDDVAQMANSLKQIINGGGDEYSDIFAQWPEFELLASARDYPARHPAIFLPYQAVMDLTIA